MTENCSGTLNFATYSPDSSLNWDVIDTWTGSHWLYLDVVIKTL